MASAQVKSNSAVSSRKQEHLEAGKRRLEEFRKKKAAARKAVSTSQPSSVASTHESQASQNGQVESVSSVSAVDGRHDSVTETSGFHNHYDKSRGHTTDNGSELLSFVNVNPENHDFSSSGFLQLKPKQEGNGHETPGLKSQTGLTHLKQTEDRVAKFGTDIREGKYDVFSSAGRNVPQIDNSNLFRNDGTDVRHSNKDVSSSESSSDSNASFNGVAAKFNAQGHATNLVHHDEFDFRRSQCENLEFKSQSPTLEDRMPSKIVDKLSNFYTQQAAEPLSTGSNSDVSGSSSGPSHSSVTESHPRRLRPSFLDSLSINRESLATAQPSEKENFMTSKFSNSDFVAPSAMHEPSTPFTPVEPLPMPVSRNPGADIFGSAVKEQHLFENSLKITQETNFPKQNDDFAALEQHIEDLTQEKFSLQRSLEASKALADSLAAENSSLTESYNQQAGVVNQLKAEMEKLQGEIKARLIELESFKAEYMNAQLECNAADERAKLLASEVIGLEEKALRLRSNELKLERELENSSADIASFKKRLSTLEKERQDLLQTIDALQEEKKLLQSKIRRASASGISIDNKGHVKKDVSTSTTDLDLDTALADGERTQQAPLNAHIHEDTDNYGPLDFEDSVAHIPSDQMQMVQNINSLISEIMAEKEELVQALVTEVSTNTKLKDLNKELSQKLEVQTQRLELLTSQSMKNENIPARQASSSIVVHDSFAYADEGDEVVERVLGWIMKLFPGGPSKRRSSRL